MTIDYSTTTTEAMYYVVGSPICYGVIHKDKPLELTVWIEKKPYITGLIHLKIGLHDQFILLHTQVPLARFISNSQKSLSERRTWKELGNHSILLIIICR